MDKLKTCNEMLIGTYDFANYMYYDNFYFEEWGNRMNYEYVIIANFILLLPIFMEKYMEFVPEDLMKPILSYVPLGNLKAVRNALEHGDYHVRDNREIDMRLRGKCENYKLYVYDFVKLIDLMFSGIDFVNKNKTSLELSDNNRLEYAIYNNMQILENLAGFNGWNNREPSFIKKYDGFDEDMKMAAFFAYFYANSVYLLEKNFLSFDFANFELNDFHDSNTNGNNRDLLRHLRNSFSHGNVKVCSNGNIDFKDYKIRVKNGISTIEETYRKIVSFEEIKSLISAINIKQIDEYTDKSRSK